MDFDLTEEQRLVCEMVGRFAKERLEPGVAEREKEHRFASELLPEAAELGLCGICVPEKWGGAGMDMVSYVLVMEELASADPAFTVSLSVTNSVCGYPLLRWGTDEQREKFLRPVSRGEHLGGFCLTEPGAGSDSANLQVTARLDGDDYVLNGTKAWVTNAQVGKLFIVIARTGSEATAGRNTAFIVEADRPGFRVAKLEEKMGIHSSMTGEVVFEDCRVPVANRLGEEGQGMEVALGSLDTGRIGIGAQSLGIARGALDEALRYSQERQAFGRPISSFQALQFLMADSWAELEAARLLVLRAARARDEGAPFTRFAASAKYYASEMANRVCARAVQVFGGYGYSAEYKVQRLYRDARVLTIYEGTSQIQQLVIARELLLEWAEKGPDSVAGP